MNESGETTTSRPAEERAAEIVDQAGERVGRWAAQLSQRLQHIAARAREEGEDIWAEAQSLRRDGHA